MHLLTMDFLRNISKQFPLFLLIALLCIPSILCEDFYALLGIKKDANNREIRRAFKKIALQKHPDKNQDNPSAHEEFIKINRAYEVLKDDETRKKYDQYGEEGLKDDFQRGRRYESWNFYQQDFGIYDDDLEIVTLDQSDFEQSVENADDIWFINFYSPRCGHCHDLAPTWREVARELEGVIRIGAVNCADANWLCRQQGIRSYPSLVMFPQKEKYQGERSQSKLVEHALHYAKTNVVRLRTQNFENVIAKPNYVKNPWLITFCSDEGDCLDSTTTLKLSAMLAELVNIGRVECYHDHSMCDKLGRDHGTAFYFAGKVEKSGGNEISSLYPKEIVSTVLSFLPDVATMDKEQFEKMLEDVRMDRDMPWLVHFMDDEAPNLEFKKLPVMLEGIRVGRVDCRRVRTMCNERHVHKFPTFVLFKQGGGYEIHHGRQTAHDIAVFAEDSSTTPVRVLSPEDFPHPVTSSGDLWFVDFFAPWCPPCMRLLPVFRKTSKMADPNISFGTVDCTIHNQLCAQHNIHSYPTTIFYNDSVPHKFSGHHSSDAILEFIQDTLHPPVIALTPDDFQTKVLSRGSDEVWLVDFFAPWCGPCMQLAPEWRRLAKTMKDTKNVYVASMDCQMHSEGCSSQHVHSYPQIRLYAAGGRGSYQQYQGWFRDAHNINIWAQDFLPSFTEKLTWGTFSHEVLESEEPWIVDFYAPWCGPCQRFSPHFERVAQELEGKVRCGKVDCERQQHLCQQAGIRSYPTVRFYSGTTNGYRQNFYDGDPLHADANSIITYARNFVTQRLTRDEL